MAKVKVAYYWFRGARQALRNLRWTCEGRKARIETAREWLSDPKLRETEDDDFWAMGYVAMLKKISVRSIK